MARKAERARGKLEVPTLSDTHFAVILTPKAELQLCFNVFDVGHMDIKRHNVHGQPNIQVPTEHLQALPKSSTSRAWLSHVFQVNMGR